MLKNAVFGARVAIQVWLITNSWILAAKTWNTKIKKKETLLISGANERQTLTQSCFSTFEFQELWFVVPGTGTGSYNIYYIIECDYEPMTLHVRIIVHFYLITYTHVMYLYLPWIKIFILCRGNKFTVSLSLMLLKIMVVAVVVGRLGHYPPGFRYTVF